MVKANKAALAVTLAVIYGVMLFAICLVSALTGWAKDIMAIYASFFPGVAATLIGSAHRGRLRPRLRRRLWLRDRWPVQLLR